MWRCYYEAKQGCRGNSFINHLYLGTNTPLMKMGLVYIPPILYNAFRLLLATAFAWPILVYSGTYKPLQRGDGRCILAVSVFGFFLAQLLLLIGLPQTTAGNASIMSALVPLTVVMINRIFKSEVVPFVVTVGIGISLMG